MTRKPSSAPCPPNSCRRQSLHKEKYPHELWAHLFRDVREILELGIEPQELADRLGHVIDVMAADLERVKAPHEIALKANMAEKAAKKYFHPMSGISGNAGNTSYNQAPREISACFEKESE